MIKRILFVQQPGLPGDISVPREPDCANPQKDYFIQPIGLAYMAGTLRKHVPKAEIKIIDANVLRKDYGWVKKQIESFQPDIVIGNFALPTYKLDMKLGNIVKDVNKSIKFGLWGPIAYNIRNFLFKQFPELDFIISNEPEFTLVDLVKKGKLSVKGVVLRKGKKIINMGMRPLRKNIDELGFPAYDLLPLKKYYTPYARRLPIAFIRTSRGCPYSCIFCVVGGQTNDLVGYGHRWRAYSPQRAVEEIEWIVNDLGVREVVMFDPEFVIDKNRVKEICRLLKEKDLDFIWCCQARLNTVDKETLKAMKEAGCYAVSYGLETITPEVMRIIRKGVSKELAIKVIKETCELGLLCGINFMVGLPGETPESFMENIKFARYLARHTCARPQCTVATPYPGTVFYEMVKKNGWLKSEDYESFEQTTPIVSYPYFTAEEIERMHIEFYRKVVLDPIRLIKRVLRIRHLNELKNIWLALKDFGGNLLKRRMRYVR